MSINTRCMYDNDINSFLGEDNSSILGKLYGNYHGESRTTTIEAWQVEILIIKEVLSCLEDKNVNIIFEYDMHIVYCSQEQEPEWLSVFLTGIRTEHQVVSGKMALGCRSIMMGHIHI